MIPPVDQPKGELRTQLTEIAAQAYDDTLAGKRPNLNPFEAIADAVVSALATKQEGVKALSEDEIADLEMRAKDEGVDFVFDALAAALGAETWVQEDGSETWDGDVRATLWRILYEARVLDPFNNKRVVDNVNAEALAALQTLLDASNAIIGADTHDDEAIEAFDLFNDARLKARAAIRHLKEAQS